MIINFLLFFGVFGLSSASNCFPNEALPNFDMINFQGKWYELNIVSTGHSKSELPDNLRCSTQNFIQGYKKYRTQYDVDVGDEHKVYPHILNVSDSTRAHLTSDLMEVNVVCTDYTSWAVVHSCLYQDNMYLDLITLMGRSKDEYDKIASNNEVQECLSNMATNLDQGWRIDHSNCKN